jgi:hypothetical protein
VIIKVHNAATEETKTFKGTPEQLIAQLDASYAWLKQYEPNGLQDMIRQLSNQQMFFVEVSG